MTTVALNLDLPPHDYQRLLDAARVRQRPVVEVVQAALSEWLTGEERLQQARAVMREPMAERTSPWVTTPGAWAAVLPMPALTDL